MTSVALTGAHWMYLLGVIVIIITMVLRANVVVPAIAATFLVSLAYSGSVVSALESVFNGSLTAAGDLFHVLQVHPDIADVGKGEGDDLGHVGGIGEDLLVAGHGGVEADLAHRLAFGPMALSLQHRAVGHCDDAGHAR